MNEDYHKFMKAMDAKYGTDTTTTRISPSETILETLLRMEKEFQLKYSSIELQGGEDSSNKRIDPNEYFDETEELSKRKTKHNKAIHNSNDTNHDLKEKTDETTEKIFKQQVVIEEKIDSIHDLLKMIEKYPLHDEIEYNIDMAALNKIKPGLLELNAMIGMKSLKENIVDQILYYLQGLHKDIGKHMVPFSPSKSSDFLHTVIYGPPGTGKTEIAKIIGKIFAQLGILKKGTFKKAVRSDLIAGYLGQTAIKTKEVITECLGGVLFIDEAYALGNPEKRDSFSKECIDTLCEAMSDYKDELMVIIAGYDYELKECFFSLNQGLDSRFTWRFKTDEYKAKDLHDIFLKKVTDFGWSATEDIKTDWFEKNMDYFKYFGRDMETLFSKTKIAHSKRVFCLPENEKRIVSIKDLEKGFEMYLKNDEVKSRKEQQEIKKQLSSIYV